MEHFKITGIKITAATVEEIHHQISRMIEQNNRQGFILSGNVYGFNLAWENQWLADFYNRADIVHCDGAGIMLAARILEKRIPERITYADWGWTLGKYCAEKGHSIYLLGGPKGLAEAAGAELKARFPGLALAGCHHGYFEKSGPENDAVIADINRAAPDLLFVGMGMLLQERWMLQYSDQIRTKVFLTCGAAFRYWAGWYSRCPDWMGKMGMEWIYRFLLEPKRLANRYLIGNPLFMQRVVKEKMRYNSL